MKIMQHKSIYKHWYLPLKRIALAPFITLFSSAVFSNSFVFPESVSIVRNTLAQSFADSKSLKSVNLRGESSLAGFVKSSILTPQPNLKGSVASALVLHRVSTDGKHARYNQIFHGHEVFGGQVIAHLDRKGVNLDHITGNFITGLENASVAIKAGLTDDQAIEVAKQKMDDSKNWEFQNTEVELFIYHNPNREGFQPALAYIVNFLATSESAELTTRPFMVIDAQTGTVLDKWEGLNT